MPPHPLGDPLEVWVALGLAVGLCARSRMHASVVRLAILLGVLVLDGVDCQLAGDRLPNPDRWLVGMVKMDLQPPAFMTAGLRAEQNPAPDRPIRHPESILLKLTRHPTEYAWAEESDVSTTANPGDVKSLRFAGDQQREHGIDGVPLEVDIAITSRSYPFDRGN